MARCDHFLKLINAAIFYVKTFSKLVFLDKLNKNTYGLPGHRTSTALQFFLWSYINILVYSLPVDSEEGLYDHIFEAAATMW